jgi:hypothetical protein
MPLNGCVVRIPAQRGARCGFTPFVPSQITIALAS